jgi:uncharacterized protein (UPF0212 family)
LINTWEELSLRLFSASDLLTVWERGMSCPPAEKALLLLRVAFPDAPTEVLANLTIGQRDLCLLKLREMTFGTRLTGVTVCPECSERVELDFDSREIADGNVRLPDFQESETNHIEFLLNLPGWELRFRLPTNADLTTPSTDSKQAQTKLLEACLINIRHDGETVPPAELPPELVTAIAERMAQEDPYLNISLGLKCPACGHQWQMIFDIVSYFSSEINTWAARILREVHHLASAYGWREADILSMSAWRRQQYLELIGVG